MVGSEIFLVETYMSTFYLFFLVEQKCHWTMASWTWSNWRPWIRIFFQGKEIPLLFLAGTPSASSRYETTYIGSSAAEWSKEADFLDWFDQDFSDSESYQESKRWSSKSHISVVHLAESKPLYRTSLYPQRPQQLQHFLSEPILVPKSSFNSFPPPGGQSQQSSP
ncbi:hypothetical protein MTR67_032032 [Solanum verrucosum]|uniref:Uncharacterized protein n=1 Tax=Solanum verrucosum TaxID=315347 RepID=A0AAF0U3I4_SOLVR|nr:hypothetical protein MTR67_032032 [Solanum verrucosum]